MLTQFVTLSEAITSVSLRNRFKDSKILLHTIQVLPESKETLSHFKYLKEKASKSYYMPSLTMEYVYHHVFTEPLRQLWDSLIEDEDKNFIVYLTDSENYLFYFISAEQISQREKFDFRKTTASVSN